MNRHIHLVSFDIPYPPDYGGVIDVFYKILHLQRQGIDVTLHCFEYGKREVQAELLLYCRKVFYYPRGLGFQSTSISLPYIVSSRSTHDLLHQMTLDSDPIIFEGTHSTYLVKHPLLKDRVKILRAHNVEYKYYRELAKNTSFGWKKIYYWVESFLLQNYEARCDYFNHVLAVSTNEIPTLQKLFPSAKVHYLPSFHPYSKIKAESGRGKYCIYHGNLSIPENQKAVDYLVRQIFSSLKIPLIIAGKNPSAKILSYASEWIQVIADPSLKEMQELIANAHIHVLPIFQDTGLKLKLLSTLFGGRFCVTNDCFIEPSLQETIVKVESAEAFRSTIVDLMQRDFTEEDMEIREIALDDFQDDTLVKKLLKILWPYVY